MANILLIQPPLTEKELFARGSKTSASILPPLGLAYIAAMLRQHGHSCTIIDGVVESVSTQQLAEKTKWYDLVGVTVVTAYAMRATELIREIKEVSPNIPVVVGGPHVSALPEHLLLKGADYAVIGEGELTMTELVNSLSNSKFSSIHSVKGIGFLEDGRYVFTGKREKLVPLDQIPLPARDLLPMHKYRSSIARDVLQPSLSLLTSRGCPGVCSFCFKKIFGTQVRYFSVERIIEEFFVLRNRYGARSVAIYDDNFLADPNMVKAVCHALTEHRIDLPFSVEARIDNINADVLSTLKNAHCASISIGIESGSQRILNYINKRTTLTQIYETVSLIKESKIPIRAYFMLGFPTETEMEMEETIRLALDLDIEWASFTLLLPFPGTLEYKRAQESGTFDPAYFEKMIVPEFNFLTSPIYIPEGLTGDRLLQIHRNAYNRYYFRPKMFWRKLLSLRSVDNVRAAVLGGTTLFKNFVLR